MWSASPHGGNLLGLRAAFGLPVRLCEFKMPIIAFLGNRMPSINFNISTGLIPFHNLWSKDFGQIAKNKFIEMELLLDDTLIGFDLELGFRGWSHAGPGLSISLLFLTFHAHIYDGRHWDHERGCWEEHDGES